MTTINANLQDSLGQPLTGYIKITLAYDLDTDTGLRTRVPGIVMLVNGQASFNLAPSESDFITYYFEYYNSSVNPAVRIKDFSATVPDSATAIDIADLEPTGITHDALDTSLSAITRRLYLNDTFWDRFQDNIMSIKGTFSPLAWYKRGDFVYHQGGSYVFINKQSASGQVPVKDTTTAYWHPVAAEGQPGSGTTGSLNLYDVVNWNNSSVAVSQHAIRDIVENIAAKKVTVDGLAPLVNATLTAPRVQVAPAAADSSTLIPSTAWVQAIAAQLQKAINPIGAVQYFAGSSAPTNWLIADGRAVSRSTYSALYAVLGNTYGAGDGNTTFNLPDLRGRVALGVDSTPVPGAANRVPGVVTGSAGGANNKTLATSEMPSHSHGVTDPGHIHSIPGVPQGGGALYQGGSTYGSGTINTASSTTGVTIQNTGGGQSFSLMNPYLGLLPIIYAGV